MGFIIVKEEGAVLWVNLGRPIVTNRTSLHCYVKVREPNELSLGVVIGVDLGILALDGGPRGREFGGIFAPIALNDVFFA